MILAPHGRSPIATILAFCTVLTGTVVASTGCGGGAAPTFEPLSDQVGQVGVELKVELRGVDLDGDKLSYRFTSDVPGLDTRATVARTPTDTGIFRWTPVASDIGDWNFDFIVSDGDHDTKTTVKVTIKSSIGSESAPIFREPLGSGTTIDLTRTECIDLNIVVEDQDTAQVEIAQEEPLIENATLMAVDGTTAEWRWCPTQAQVDAESRYTLTLSADDLENPKSMKNYLLVLRGRVRPDCPGESPGIVHSAQNADTILDLPITATITDDLGLKQAPLLYYSTTQPSAPPDLSQMTQITMALKSGNMQSGTWSVNIPNPVFDQPTGTSANLYYVIVADDDDDAMGNCDHVTTSNTFLMKVTSSGTGDAGLCNACSGDRQCGGDGDLCVRVGSSGDAFCLQACTSACPAGYTCSSSPVASVDGTMANQCVPVSGSCSAVGAMCQDDTYEENDSRSQASAQPELVPDLYDMVSCPRTGSTTLADDDWFKIKLAAPSRVNLEIAGEASTDLDLGLYRSDGTRITSSTSRSASEMITKCLAAGTYYTRVYGYGYARNAYLFDYATTAETCSTCVDDAIEDDDSRSQARPKVSSNPLTLPHTAASNQICPNDDDWYRVRFVNGDTVKVVLTFNQTNATQDLDLHFYNDLGVDQTPCSEADPTTCASEFGQGAVSNETTQQTIATGCPGPMGCDYYFVVRGYAASSAPYSIAITKI